MADESEKMSIDELRKLVEKRTGSELIKELVTAIPYADKELLRSRLSILDVQGLIDAVVAIRTQMQPRS